MVQVRFIKLKRPEKAKHLCRLAETFFAEGKRVLIIVQDDNQAITLDRFMWVWDKGSFIPHAYDNGSVDCLDEPIVITTDQENPNAATVLIMGKPCSIDFIKHFDQVVDFAETYDNDLADQARSRFVSYREHGFNPQMYE
ncbi:MAG: DNA polymerase III subunit chi [Desulfuromonas sp.]|nr:MAG: DNA polymerase III subunit chi [Desulfuromonas sp.]